MRERQIQAARPEQGVATESPRGKPGRKGAEVPPKNVHGFGRPTPWKTKLRPPQLWKPELRALQA
eukprot:12204482-Alexandrium_andersonii.AAC.1